MMDPMLGVVFHAMGGLAARGFYAAVGRHPPGGSTTNYIWCVWLGRKNRISANYGRAFDDGWLRVDYPLCMTDDVLWHLLFFFSGMGSTQTAKYNYASWFLHMAFIITSNAISLSTREWRGIAEKPFTPS